MNNMQSRLLKDPATAGCRIFIGHLQTEDMNRNELEQHFSKYGTIVGSTLNRGFGFVQFEDEKSAQNAIKSENGAMFKNRRIDVKPAKNTGPLMGNSGGGNTGAAGGKGGNSGAGGGSGGGFGGNDQFNNSNFGQGNARNSNFKNDQFRTGGDSSFTDDSFGNGDSFGMNKSGGPSFGGGNRNQGDGGRGGRGGNRGGRGGGGNKNNQMGRGDMGESFGDVMGGAMGRGDRMGAGMGGNMGGGNMGGGMGGNMGGGMGGNMGGGMGGNIGGGMGGNIGGGMGGNIGGGMGGMGSAMSSSGMGNPGKALAGMGNPGMGDGMSGGMGEPMDDRSNMGPNFRSNVGGGGNIDRGGMGSNMDRGGMGGNFRDRSPLNRSGRMDDNWEFNKSGPGGPGARGGPGNRGNFGGFGDRKSRFDDFKGTPGGPVRDMGPAPGGPVFGQPVPTEYPSIAAEKNDCEIIVVNKSLTEYAEIIEARLKKLGLTVDLLFPNEDVPLTRVLGNIASRGCLYAIVISPTNKEHRSLTLNILHGLPQEHRNMPVDDAITLIMRDFSIYKSGGRSVPANTPSSLDRHPDAIQVLLNLLADNLQLTVLQYDRVIKYLEMRREEQVQFELGEDAKNLAMPVSDPKQAELQSRIMNILNSNKSNSTTPASNTVTAASAPSPVPPVPVSTAVSTSASNNSAPVSTPSTVAPSPLLNDPTVQKALDSLLQGNLLKNIGDQSTPASSATPLFAAFPSMNRF